MLQKTKVIKVRKVSKGEQIFINCWLLLGIEEAYPYEPGREFKFHPARDWRLDFSWIVEYEGGGSDKIGVEIEGGVFSGGAHTRGVGYTEDCEKYNEAVLLGWKLLRFTIQQLENDPVKCIGQVVRLLKD